MEIFITSRHLVKLKIPEFKPTEVISIVDPEDDYLEFNLPKETSALQMKFQDLCFEPASEYDIARYLPPTKSMIKTIIKYGEHNIREDSRLLVHCFAGISRSSAAAIIAMIPLLGPEEAVKRVMAFEVHQADEIFEPGYSWFLPNNLMIKYADEELGLAGRLIKLTESSFNY